MKTNAHHTGQPDAIVSVDVYRHDVYVFHTPEGLLARIGEEHGRIARFTGARTAYSTDGGPILLYIPRRADVSTLTHECVHVAHVMLDRVGVPVTPEHDEALAYLVGHLVRMLAPIVRPRLA